MSSKLRQFPQPKLELVYDQLGAPGGRLIVQEDDGYCDAIEPSPPTLDSFGGAKLVEAEHLRQHDRPPGDYPWDHWKKWALEDGVPQDLAELGRSLIREADQHTWPMDIQAECGWNDSGAEMIRLALNEPEKARARWSHLLETDAAANIRFSLED